MPPGLRRSSRVSKPVIVKSEEDDEISSSESSSSSPSVSPSKRKRIPKSEKNSEKKKDATVMKSKQAAGGEMTSKQQRGRRKRPLGECDIQDEVTNTVTKSEHSTAASACDPIPRKRVTRSRSTARGDTSGSAGGKSEKNSCTASTNNDDSIDKKKTGEAGKCTTDGLDEKSSPAVVVTSNYFASTGPTESQSKKKGKQAKKQSLPQVKPAVVNNAIEPKKRAVKTPAPTSTGADCSSDDDDDNDEWEEVEDADASENGDNEILHREEKDILLNSIDSNGIDESKTSANETLEIEVDRATGKKSQPKKQVDPWEVNRRKINAQKKANQVRSHKTHILCLIGCGLHLNSLTYLPEIQGLTLSIVDFVFKKVPKKFDVETIDKLIREFTSVFKYIPACEDDSEKKDADTKEEDEDEDDGEEKKKKKKETTAAKKKRTAGLTINQAAATKSFIVDRLSDCLSSRTAKNNLEYILAFISLLRIIRLNLKKDLQVRLCIGLNPITIHPSDLIPPNARGSKGKSGQKEESSPPTKANKGKKGKKNPKSTLSSSDESDYEISCTKMTKAKTIIPHRKPRAPTAKANQPHKVTFAIWPEIKLTAGRWVPVYFLDKIIIDDPVALIKQTKLDPLYVYAFDDKSYMKDVTARYAPDFLEPSFRKNRADNKWLDQTLPKFTGPSQDGEDENEVYEIQIKLSEKPMPTSVSGFKNHPFYILKRHLLAYETIYPNNAEPVAFFKDEPVYDRNNVRPVHTRDYYRREARVVKEGEEAYKFTKGKRKWSRALKTYVDDPPRELFGEWQTEPYDPPTAENGIVPRNEFNNVELFKPCMLPKGCVHMRVPGLLRIAKKLNIDCVPAVTGFDNVKGSGGVVPIMDGFVVCEEFEDILLEAFHEEQVNQQKKEASKRIARINANWRRLTRALIIRERLRNKYDDC